MKLRRFVKHAEPKFSLDRTFVIDGEENKLAFELTSDGKELIRQDGNRELHSELKWQDQYLVFRTQVLDPINGEGINRVVYMLEDDARVLIADERFESAAQRYKNKWVFDKKE